MPRGIDVIKMMNALVIPILVDSKVYCSIVLVVGLEVDDVLLVIVD